MHFLVDAILFDIDGTLVDSTGAVTRTWRVWAGRHGVDVEKILRVSHGRRTEDTVALFLPEDERDDAVAELEELELNDMDGVVALPGAEAVLSRLASTRWAAVTSGSQCLMRKRLAVAGLPVPDVLIAADDVIAGKPDPEGYRKAAVELGWDITHCLVVEDAPAGIEAGRSSGARTLAVATTHERIDLDRAESVMPDLTALTVEQMATCLLVNITL
jgi:sugar-phosphatase